MTESDYKYLQERLSKKSENNPYKHTGCTNYETGYKEGIAAAKSILSEFYHRVLEWSDFMEDEETVSKFTFDDLKMVCRCGSKEFFTEKHGNQTGLYCSACGKWQKWLKKDEIRLFNHGVQDDWISVKDNLPDTIRTVMMYTNRGCICCGWYNPELHVWFDICGLSIRSVTHWREFPDPPRMEVEE